jgi:hypothetical protein
MTTRGGKWGKTLYEPSAIAAAKVIAEQIGAYGKVGGWIYDKNDRPMFHGWYAYAEHLTAYGVIKEKLVTDPSKGKKVTRYAINWRRLRRPL